MSKWQESEDALENELNKGALWAVTYGDLMSYLMIFFLIMFNFAMGKGKNLESAVAGIQKSFGGKVDPGYLEKKTLRQKEQESISDVKAAVKSLDPSMIQVQESEQKVKLILQSPVLFDPGQSDLRPEFVPVLKTILEPLKKLSNTIIVEGHTDNAPVSGNKRFSSNWELSMARAYSVICFLQINGIPPERLSGLGYGEHRPVDSNAGLQGRARNRRIEIVLIKVGNQ